MKFFSAIAIIIIGAGVWLLWGSPKELSFSSVQKSGKSFSQRITQDTADRLQHAKDRAGRIARRISQDVEMLTASTSQIVRESAYRSVASSARKTVNVVGEILGVPVATTPVTPTVKPPLTSSSPSRGTEKNPATVILDLEKGDQFILCNLAEKGETLSYALEVKGPEQETYAVEVQWGDGGREPKRSLKAGQRFTVSHKYQQAGSFNFSVHLTDSRKKEYLFQRSVCIEE